MENKSKTIRRADLYDQVWTVAITKLSKQYGLLDVGLAKICKKNNIPRPSRGYWAKKAAGYKLKRLPLPPGENVAITITANPYSRDAGKDDSLFAKALPGLELEQNPIVVPGRLTNPHPLITQTSEILSGRKANDTGLITPPEKGCLDVAVSKESLRRALRLMDTVIKALEKQGCQVYLSGNRTKTEIQGVVISFGLSENLSTRKRRPEEHDLDGRYRFGHNRYVEDRVPSGSLCFSILEAEGFYIHGCQQNWNDGKRSKLENRLNSIVEGLAAVAAAKIQRDMKREEEARQRAEQLKRLEEERLKRAELRRKYLEEEARVVSLITEAENWKKSQILREYIAEVEKFSSIDGKSFAA